MAAAALEVFLPLDCTLGPYSPFLDVCTLPPAPNTCITPEFLSFWQRPFCAVPKDGPLAAASVLSGLMTIKDVGEARALNSSGEDPEWSSHCLDGGCLSCKGIG